MNLLECREGAVRLNSCFPVQNRPPDRNGQHTSNHVILPGLNAQSRFEQYRLITNETVINISTVNAGENEGKEMAQFHMLTEFDRIEQLVPNIFRH